MRYGEVIARRDGAMRVAIPVVGVDEQTALDAARRIAPDAVSYEVKWADESWEELQARQLQEMIDWLWSEEE